MKSMWMNLENKHAEVLAHVSFTLQGTEGMDHPQNLPPESGAFTTYHPRMTISVPCFKTNLYLTKKFASCSESMGKSSMMTIVSKWRIGFNSVH